MNESTFKGNSEYCTQCTGDACIGDEVAFERATFSGFKLVEGVVIADSYGEEKQRHTFILELKNGSILIIKASDLYRNRVYRKPWENESRRDAVLFEKHRRGNAAREARRPYFSEEYSDWFWK